jgi:hypothetical protein
MFAGYFGIFVSTICPSAALGASHKENGRNLDLDGVALRAFGGFGLCVHLIIPFVCLYEYIIHTFSSITLKTDKSFGVVRSVAIVKGW